MYLQTCRLVLSAGTVWPVKNEDVHERICVVHNSACWFKAAYRASVAAKSIFIHPVDYTTAWQGCPRATKASGDCAGGRPEYRARKVEGNWRRLANKSNLSPMLCFVFVERAKLWVQNPDRRDLSGVSCLWRALVHRRWEQLTGEVLRTHFSVSACVCEVSGWC